MKEESPKWPLAMNTDGSGTARELVVWSTLGRKAWVNVVSKGWMRKLSAVSGGLAILFLLGLAACGGQKPSLTPQEVAKQGSEKMLTVNSFHSRIDINGTGAYLDQTRTMKLNFTEGDLVRPDKVKATLNIAFMSMVVEARVVILGQDKLFSNPLTNKWEPLPKGWDYDPTVLFDPTEGISGVAKKISGLQMLNDQKVDGIDCYHLTGTVKASDIRQFTAGMINGDEVKLDLWVGKDDRYIHLVRIEEPQSNGGQATVWTMQLSSFNNSVSIERPSTG